MAKTVVKETRCCIFQSIKKFACEFGIKEDAERKSPSNGMSALCEPKILERLWLCVLVWLCLHLGSQKAIWSLRGRGSNPVGRIVGDIKGGHRFASVAFWRARGDSWLRPYLKRRAVVFIMKK